MKSPFAGARSAVLELKNMKSNGFKIFSLVAIAAIPLIYAGLFLLAFLDPYGNLNQVPAAVVNLDKGAIIQEDQRNIGQELCDELVKNNEEAKPGEPSGYDWKFVGSVDEAREGLEDATYYMELVIPENFSESIASADSKNPEKAELQVHFNPSTNLIAQTVGQSMVTKIKAELNEKVQQSYFENIFVSLSNAADDLGTAVDGSADLAEGLATAKDGSQVITYNLGKLASGASDLEKGLGDLSEGAASLDSGASTLSKGTTDLHDGTAKLNEGAKALQGGAEQLDSGAGDLASGASKLRAEGTSVLAAGASQLEQATAALPTEKQVEAAVSGSEQIKEGLGQVASGLGMLRGSLDEAAQGASGYEQAIVAMASALTEEQKAALAVQGLDVGKVAAGASAGTLSAGLEQAASSVGAKNAAGTLLGGVNDLSSAYGQLSGQLMPLVQSAPALRAAVQQLNQGAAAVDQNMQALSAGASTLSQGAAALKQSVGTSADSAEDGTVYGAANSLNAGAGQLESGAQALAEGAGKLKDGAQTAHMGAQTLESGAQQLEDGSATLTDGLVTAADGSEELHDGLDEGQQEMASKTQNSSAKSEMMSAPVSANGSSQTGESITQVANYGTGFAPYFIGLGMWVGCLMITFLFRSLNNRILMSNANTVSAVFSSFLPMGLIAVVQVLILLAFVQFGLGFNVNFQPQYYLFGILVALTFMAIVQFFRAAFGTAGMVVIVVLLMLQLCTAAGTFPIETELPVFNLLNPILPMTHVVRGFRMAMCGLDLGYLVQPSLILLGFLVLFLTLTTVVAHSRRRANMNMLYPKIQMAH